MAYQKMPRRAVKEMFYIIRAIVLKNIPANV